MYHLQIKKMIINLDKKAQIEVLAKVKITASIFN